MARFDVHRLEHPGTLALVLQADLLDGFNTRVVVPLVTGEEFGTRIEGLNPLLTINGLKYVMLTQHLATVPAADLGDVVCNLSELEETLVAATKLLFDGL